MSNINNGGPAFPAATCGDWQIGMSLRDWFAGKALEGALAGLSDEDRRFLDKAASDRGVGIELIALASYKIADAMIKARGETA